jgi:hypothetical protein
MHRIARTLALAATALIVCANAALAWHLDGHVYCAGTGLPLAGVTIDVANSDGGEPFSATGTTDENGYYFIALFDTPRDYQATADVPSGTTVTTPVSGSYLFSTTDNDFEIHRDWVLDSPACSNGACWLTGGGAKFSNITNTNLGEYTRVFNWGGNVNPGCSPTAGQGGEWNNLDVEHKLHFHGTAMHVVRCGNVDGIPPGSTSPVTPFNFIEWEGVGTLKGIKGNKVDAGVVYFFARAEDRNEPGSNGQRDGAGKDRYFLNVYSDPNDPAGSSLMLVDQDGDPSTVDPIVITDGNLQIHITSCDFTAAATQAPATSRMTRNNTPVESAIALPHDLALSSAWPNPSLQFAGMRFSLPHDANVSLSIFDVSGRRVADLASGVYTAGDHGISWNLRSRDGQRVGGGVYFARLVVEGKMLSRSLVVSP